MLITGDYATAEQAFTDCAKHYAEVGATWEFSMGLHNMAMLQVINENPAYADTLLTLEEVRGQFWDETGYHLTRANIGYIDNDTALVEDAYGFFANLGTPQQQSIEAWLEILYAQ
jgi:hypothetical protein